MVKEMWIVSGLKRWRFGLGEGFGFPTSLSHGNMAKWDITK